MASYEEYAKKYAEKQEGKEDAIQTEIVDANKQQAERQADTPDVDWEQRYKELEKLNSRQAQDLGNYRKMVDDYIVSPTPDASQQAEQNPSPITMDELYADPAEAVTRTVSAHPDIKRLDAIEQRLREREINDAQSGFEKKHPDYETITVDPAFANWVADDPTRQNLARQANEYDFSAADALFSLYKAESQIQKVTKEAEQEKTINATALETPAQGEQPAPQAYSRSEMLAHKVKAKQGNLESDAYVKAHAASYLQALADGNVSP